MSVRHRKSSDSSRKLSAAQSASVLHISVVLVRPTYNQQRTSTTGWPSDTTRLRRAIVEPTQVAEKLYALTGSLKASGRSTPADLAKARAALAATIASGRSADTRPTEIVAAIERSSGLRFAQLDPGERRQFSDIQAGAAPGFIASSPVVSAFGASTPAWARGMALESIGPFEQSGSPAPSWGLYPDSHSPAA
jgi:hypothetical protein